MPHLTDRTWCGDEGRGRPGLGKTITVTGYNPVSFR